MITHTGEHVGNWAGDFDTQQSCNAKQETEDACNQASPEEYVPVPGGCIHECPEFPQLAIKEDERSEEPYRS